jgi:hypothetical protein
VTGSVVSLVRDGVLDAELAALVWLLVEAAVPVHVAARDLAVAAGVAEALRPLASDLAIVSSGSGAALEEVLRQPVPFRPPAGGVLIVDEARVVAAHFQRPPLRDAGGHVRPQGPAVLATWDAGVGAWEHFAWGIVPELADATQRKAGDFEIEQGRRREYLEALVASPLRAPDEVARALRGYALGSRPA